MLVEKEQLVNYNIPDDLFFARRYGVGDPISREQFFMNNPAYLVAGLYCAIGNDEKGWQLEQFNGVNWTAIDADPNYNLIITNDGLNALTNTLRGGFQLYFSGLKILDNTILDPSTPLINWTDTDFVSAGNVMFSIGTQNSVHPGEDIDKILSYRYNMSNGGLQYSLTLPTQGLGSIADNGAETWNIGAIGLYVKAQNTQGNTFAGEDVLFAIATLPLTVVKYGDTASGRIGNTLRFYFNTVLNNLGYVANVELVAEGEQSIPEVPNESLLLNPYNATKRPHNCYLVDNLYGTGMPALAVARDINSENQMTPSWTFFQPNDNVFQLPADSNYFAPDVQDYMFIYWCAAEQLYKRAEGRKAEDESIVENLSMPIGIKVGNSIVFSGNVSNNSAIYTYYLDLVNSGRNYATGDILYLPVTDNLIFKLQVTSVNGSTGSILDFISLGPKNGSIDLPSPAIIVNAIYDNKAEIKDGREARFKITKTEQPKYQWDFPAEFYNKPLYCDEGDMAGMPTITRTDSFLGWCTGPNSIQLALDLRNEATTSIYGTTRYATDCETRDVLKYPDASIKTAVTPKTLRNNYLPIVKPAEEDQLGKILDKPIVVDTFTKWNEIIVGKGVNESNNQYITDETISFYGLAFRAWYKDIAEYYLADSFYEPGTLITFGKGPAEISIATDECNGVISTKPGFQLGEKRGKLDLPVALVGKVPVMMDGNCFPKFGDKVYLSKIKPGCASTVENGKCIGKIIDKNITNSRLVNCVVKIEF